ncbi:hypothetical protein MKW98_025445 [Papaver atlanticum]|uniref:Uncharacterized protein n=1 Tax=Papaver atlanticum TaxID=357466 RepID=A0AAD4SCU0_9MAGN|nr:hypothetical protein MKW98_025445 [Papaver atlanticum]
MNDRSELPHVFRTFYKEVQTQFEKKIKIFRSDTATEYIQKCMSKFSTDHGIISPNILFGLITSREWAYLLVVALDDDIPIFCELNHVPFYKRDPDKNVDEIARTGGNHAVSGLKFRCSSMVYLQGPFDHIYRDSDARYAHTMRVWVFNFVFFFHKRPTIPAIELLDRVADRLAKENSWDQYSLHASKRVMDYYNFMNSKILFKTVRKDDKLRKLKPLPRMKVVFYVNSNQDALQAFTDGSERYIWSLGS